MSLGNVQVVCKQFAHCSQTFVLKNRIRSITKTLTHDIICSGETTNGISKLSSK